MKMLLLIYIKMKNANTFMHIFEKNEEIQY